MSQSELSVKLIAPPRRFTEQHWPSLDRERYWWAAMKADGLIPPGVPNPVSSRPDGTTSCGACGHVWQTSKRYLWWPVRLRWVATILVKHRSRSWGWWHGWQVESLCLGQERYGWTFHLGRLKILFGR